MSAPSQIQTASSQPIEIQRLGPMPGEDVSISVIIPLAMAEAEPAALISALPPQMEIVLVRGGTRASSMNRGAACASGRFLWFLHADSVLEPEDIRSLEARLSGDEALLYFDLRFDGGLLMRLTELGVFLRSRLWGLPFGDQALCLPRQMFRALGGYDERAAHGEDHLLVRKAHRSGVPVRPVGATILTSARKYRQNGWLRTTWLHLRLTLLQRVQPL